VLGKSLTASAELHRRSACLCSSPKNQHLISDVYVTFCHIVCCMFSTQISPQHQSCGLCIQICHWIEWWAKPARPQISSNPQIHSNPQILKYFKPNGCGTVIYRNESIKERNSNRCRYTKRKWYRWMRGSEGIRGDHPSEKHHSLEKTAPALSFRGDARHHATCVVATPLPSDSVSSMSSVSIAV
jgi:hypothetical protein